MQIVKLDDKGYITFPKEMRKKMYGQKYAVEVGKWGIYLKPLNQTKGDNKQ